MNIKGIIFDCDGTLVDSEEHHYLAWKHAFGKHGVEIDPTLYVNFAGKGDEYVLDYSHELIGSDCTQEIFFHKNAHYRQLQQEGIVPVAPTVDFLHRLYAERQQHGLKLGVASGARKEDIVHALQLLEVEHYFEAVLSGADDLPEYSDPEGTNKPKPYVYLKAAKLLGVPSEACIAIEDSAPGVAAAVAAGCFTIAVPNLITQNHDLSQAHLTLPSLAGMTVAQLLHLVEQHVFMD